MKSGAEFVRDDTVCSALFLNALGIKTAHQLVGVRKVDFVAVGLFLPSIVKHGKPSLDRVGLGIDRRRYFPMQSRCKQRT